MFEKAIKIILSEPPEPHYPAYYADLLREAGVPNTNDEDMISRQAAIDYFVTNVGFNDEDGYRIDDSDELRKIWTEYFDGIPSAQPETAKRIVGKSRDGMTLWYQCNMCNEPVDAQDNYCRGCGRRLING